MSPLVALLAGAVALLASSSSVGAAPQRQGVGHLGNGNINSFLQDPHLLMTQINCLKGTGPCNRLGNQLKQAVPEVINNRCGRCTATQARNAAKLIDFVQKNYPTDFKIIQARYVG